MLAEQISKYIRRAKFYQTNTRIYSEGEKFATMNTNISPYDNSETAMLNMWPFSKLLF